MLMQLLQHQSVAAERNHDVGIGGRAISVEFGELREPPLGFVTGARDEGDLVISLGRTH